MPRLPDRFDLWVRKARASADPARQLDFILGALIGLREWHFLNVGTVENPQPAEVEIDSGLHLLVFSDPDRIEEITGKQATREEPAPAISIPTTAAIKWCVERKKQGCSGLLINPGDDSALIVMPQLEAFYEEWRRRGGQQRAGFWIPNLTSEEEDFWQEHGL